MSRTQGKQQRRLSSEPLERRELLTVSPQVIRDFNPSPAQQQDSAWLDDRLLFAADDGTGDVELWKSDGTSDGTVRVADIRMGAASSTPRDFITVNQRVLFTAYSDQFGRELWATDGTEAGTLLLRDLASDTDTANLNHFSSTGDMLYFSHEGQLWFTDGTPSNTGPMPATSVTRIQATANYIYYITSLENQSILWRTTGPGAEPQRVFTYQGYMQGGVHHVGDWLYFQTRGKRSELWKSDGTEAGTTRIRSRNDLSVMAAGPDFLVYATEDWSSFDPYLDLWRTNPDNDQHTRLGRFSTTWPGNFTPVGDSVYYTAGRRLYRIDGESDRPERVRVFSDPQLSAEGDILYVLDNTDEGQKLWRSDVTEEDPQFVEVDMVASANPSDMSLLNKNQDTALFWATGSNRGLWAATAPESIPKHVNSFISGPTMGSGASSEHVVAVGDHTYFAVNSSLGTQLWQSDGTNSTPMPGAPMLPHDPRFAQVGGVLYFVGIDEARTPTLWRTDGTQAGTQPVIYQGARFTNPENLTVSDGKLYFVSPNQQGVRRIWETDGTEAGTSTLISYMDLLMPAARLTDANGTLFFDIQGGTSSDLWKREPGQGAVRIAETTGWIQDMVAAGDKVFFHVQETLDESDGITSVRNSLWVSDGTENGTVQLTDNYASSAFASGDRLFFLGYSEETGEELWVSDGTQAGTYMVKDIVVGSVGCGGNDGIHPVAYDGGIYFAAEVSQGLKVLWKSDGTEAGTVSITGIHGDPLASVNGNVYYANTDEAGTELWKSDGTVEGSMRITDINAGPGSALAKYPASVSDGKLYFTADDGFHGYELWSLPLEQETVFPGDADGNGTVDFEDFLILSANFGQTDAVFADGDFNNNGTVDFADFLILSSKFGEAQPTA